MKDADLWDTALREAEEEIGLARDTLEPLGAMSAVVTRTGIEVTPRAPGCASRATESAGPIPTNWRAYSKRRLRFSPMQRICTSTITAVANGVPQYQWQD